MEMKTTNVSRPQPKVNQDLINLDKDIALCEKLIKEKGEMPELLKLRENYKKMRLVFAKDCV